MLGIGHDAVARAAAMHADAWAGRVWILPGATTIATDAWASGFRIRRQWQAASARASLALLRPAGNGLWSARFSFEQLDDPDPDVRALASVDPAMRLFPERGLAETAVAGSLERSRQLIGPKHGYAVSGAIFALGSVRWDPATISGGRLHTGVLGAGLRLSPSRPRQATLRLDLGFPIVHSPELRGRPFISLSISPWIEFGRRRDGQRTW